MRQSERMREKEGVEEKILKMRMKMRKKMGYL